MGNLSRELRLEERKNLVIEALSVQFSRDELPMEEYERLLEYINKAETERELTIIERIVEESYTMTEADRREADYPEGDGRGHTMVSFLASRHCSGDMLRSGRSSVINILGTTTIDIQEGDLPPGRTEMHVFSVLGETRVHVPPGVRVVIKAVPIAGDTKISREVDTEKAFGRPELVINGYAVLGDIVVKPRKEKTRRSFFRP